MAWLVAGRVAGEDAELCWLNRRPGSTTPNLAVENGSPEADTLLPLLLLWKLKGGRDAGGPVSDIGALGAKGR
jgi:hypothetical protein